MCDDALRRERSRENDENEEVILPRGYVFEFLFYLEEEDDDDDEKIGDERKTTKTKTTTITGAILPPAKKELVVLDSGKAFPRS